MRAVRSFALAVVFGALLTGSVTAETAPQEARPGIGDSDADPVGRPFELPPGLVLKEPIAGLYPDDCRRDDYGKSDLQIGQGLNVRLCLSFINTTPQPIQVRLPAGLIFVSLSDETQNGLLVIVETFEVPPGDDPFFVELGLQCLNIGRSPGGLGDLFRVGPITEDEKLKRLLTQLEGHLITNDDEDVMAVQSLVWNASDDVRLDPPDHAWLANLQSR